MKHRYTYVVLRYQHSAFAGELLNAGVLLTCASPLSIKLKARKSWKRFSDAYTSFDRAAVKEDFGRLQQAINRLERELQAEPLLSGRSLEAADVMARLFGTPEGSLVWSEEGAGSTNNLDATLDGLYEEFVGRFDQSPDLNRRSDDDVFQVLSQALEGTQVIGKMTEHTVTSEMGDVKFKRAFKNGIWHCVQPLSFDLAHDEYIHSKAARWAGNLMAVSEATERFQPYLLLGRPSSSSHYRAYHAANALLRSAPANPIVVTEEESNLIADRLVAADQSD